MGSRGLLLFKGVERFPFPKQPLKLIDFNSKSIFSKPLILRNNDWVRRNCSSFTKTSANLQSSLEPPDVTRLAKTARITLTPQEVEEFAPKISQVIDWFGQLQAVDLRSVEPSIRTDTEGDNLRDDIPEAFENRDPIIAEVPNYEEPFIKVPKVLNKES